MKTTSLSWTQFLSTSSNEKNENSEAYYYSKMNHENGQILFSSHENERGEKKRSNRLASTF